MSTLKEDIDRLYKEAVQDAPEIAINWCIGRYGMFGSDHHPFVVMKRAHHGKSIWEPNTLGEFDTLNEALKIPGAQSYGSSMLCSSCSKLPSPV